MGYLGKMHKSRSKYKGGYHKGGSSTPQQEPDHRFYRRHGRFGELRTRTYSRKAKIARKLDNNPRLVRFNFLHHNL